MFNWKPNIGKKVILLLLLIFAFTGQARLFSKKAAILPELMRPSKISTNNTYLYASDKYTVSIYLLGTFKFFKRVGKKGEGPGEFKGSPIIQSFPNILAVSSSEKILFFSTDGQFLDEKRMPPKFTYSKDVYPVGKNFTGATRSGTRGPGKIFYVVSLFDAELNFLKELARVGPEKRRLIQPISDTFMHMVHEDRIYIADSSKGLFIEVFDSNGLKLYTIDKKYEKMKVTDKIKEEIEKEMNNSPIDRIEKRRKRIVYPEHFPAIRHFFVNGGRIYVFTYKEKDAKQEIIVMDLNGNTQKKVFVKKPEGRRFSVSNNTYYYLLWNETAEEWELHLETL